jgi:hypothetical protein
MKAPPALRILAATVLGFMPHSQAAVIFSDDFTSGTSTGLNTQAPQTRPGTQAWTAASVFTKDSSEGVVNSSGSGAAYLAMPTFDLSFIYVITARVFNTRTDTNWVGVGWTTQDSSTSAWNTAGTGTYWMFWRGNDEVRSFTTGAGGTTGPIGVNASGVDNVLDLRVQMDGPAGTVTYFYKNPDASTWTTYFSQVLSTTTVSSIKSVGFTTNGNNTGVISYELAVIPEPRAALLGGLGVLMLLRRRR